jgi:hypothetical protein
MIHRISPIFLNLAGKRNLPTPIRTTMAREGEEQEQHTPAASKKINPPLIEEGLT